MRDLSDSVLYEDLAIVSLARHDDTFLMDLNFMPIWELGVVSDMRSSMLMFA